MKKILLIEDDPVVGRIYRTHLEGAGYVVETCQDGESGFDRIREFNPDGILLDLMLPKLNGIELLKRLRAQSQLASVHIFVFTNAYLPNLVQEALAAGASQVFNKATLNPRQLLDSLGQLLGMGKTLLARPVLDPPTAPQASGGAAFGCQAPAEHPGPESMDENSAFQAEFYEAFLAAEADTPAQLRRLLQDFIKGRDEASRRPPLLELYRKVHALTGSAGISGFAEIAQMTSAFELLLKDLDDRPKNINASTRRTVAQAVEFIGELFDIPKPLSFKPSSANILVVDDELLSRRAITRALEKAELKSIDVEDPAVALEMVNEHRFDLCFLDVQMPGMDGFELCRKVRALPGRKHLPIVFVTGLTDFRSRARSSLSGGTDLIAKPFLFIELAVKAITLLLRYRLIPKRKAA